MLSTIQTFVRGWQIIFAELSRLFAKLTLCLRDELAKKDRDAPRRKFRDVCCIDLPPTIRARPDPFIYSQFWLMARGLGVTWDNPDFEIFDPVTMTVADRLNLVPGKQYRVDVTVHNMSFMAALGTKVHLTAHRFGAGTSVVTDLGNATIDVPGAGTRVAAFLWTTPADGGHTCLRADLSHFDD